MNPRLSRLSPFFFIALASLLLAPTFASAQDRGRSGRRGRSMNPEQMLERMEARLEAMKGPLNLTARQEQRIRQALQQGATRARRVLSQHPERGEARREAMQRVRWETEDRVHAVLNCAQRDQMRRLRREHRSERRERRQARRQNRRQSGSPPEAGI